MVNKDLVQTGGDTFSDGNGLWVKPVQIFAATELHRNPLCMKLPVIEAGQDFTKWHSTKSAADSVLSCTSLFMLP